jgi:hypothetical protein
MMSSQPVAQEDFLLFVDKADVLARLGGNSMVLSILLKKFIAGSEMEKLKEALDGDNRDDIRVVAHTVKGLAANLSMPALCKAASELEMAMKEGGEPGELPQAVYDAHEKTVFVVNAMLAEK